MGIDQYVAQLQYYCNVTFQQDHAHPVVFRRSQNSQHAGVQQISIKFQSHVNLHSGLYFDVAALHADSSCCIQRLACGMFEYITSSLQADRWHEHRKVGNKP